ncbi:hypothetical protein G6F31_013370 [Rhizopus arrhizus]|nr:hypothetical protein G6F31_013370 [Rhizopus arrhizus]
MHREQAVAAAGDRVAQLHRHLLQHILQALAFQLPAAVQQLARGQVGEHHAGDASAAGRDQQHRHRRVLHHGVEQQFALHQPLPLRTQHIAQLAVRLHQVAQLIIARPVHAEVVLTIAVAAGGAGERAHQRAHRCGRAAQGPPHQRQQDQRRYRGDHPAVIHPVRQQPRQRGSQRQHRQQAQEQAEGERAPLHSRGMPWRSMRRYSAWRLSPSSAAACAITPWLRASTSSMRARSGSLPAPGAGRGAAAVRGRLRSATSMRLPVASSWARWITLRSSRTLPGHGCRCSAVAAALDSDLSEARKRSARGTMSPGQIFAEGAVADHGRKVGIGRTDHAHLDLALAVGAQALETAGFQHAQQLHLPAQRQVADLVEEQGAAVGRFELALACLVGAGVGTGLGAEQFCFDQFRWQRTAVDGDERALGRQRIGLDDLRDLLLAGAVGTVRCAGAVHGCDAGPVRDAPRTTPAGC